MEYNNIKELQEKILKGLNLAAQKLIETKKLKQQKMVVFVDGRIQIITPV
jgi:hypothetical protein